MSKRYNPNKIPIFKNEVSAIMYCKKQFRKKYKPFGPVGDNFKYGYHEFDFLRNVKTFTTYFYENFHRVGIVAKIVQEPFAVMSVEFFKEKMQK